MHTIKVEKFEGPLELLLQLIEQKELDISEVSLADVTEQYIQRLHQVQELNPDELADFLVVAAKLLLIKSRILIPAIEVDEDASDLEIQLKIYKEYYEASKVLAKMIHKKRFLFPREKPAVAMEPVFNPPKSLTSEKLRDLFIGVLQQIEPIVTLPEEAYHRAVSIEEKISHLREHIFSQASMNFMKMISTSKDKTEIIVTFLALLELVKQRVVAVVQKSTFSDIEVQRIQTKAN